MKNREQKNNVEECRIHHNLSIKELEEMIGISPYYEISCNINGKQYYPGDLKPYFKKVMKILNSNIDDLSPIYSHNIQEPEVSKKVLADYPIEVCYDEMVERHVVVDKFLKEMDWHLTSQEKTVLQERFYKNKELSEIAKDCNLTTERIKQVEKKVLQKLRHGAKVRGLEADLKECILD